MRVSLFLSLFFCCIFSLQSQEIFLSTLNNLLYRLDLADCSYEQIGVMPTSSTDISFHPNGNLYSVSSTGSLYEIDVLSGTANLIHTFEPGASQLYTALTISAEGIFYACGLGGDLWRYDLATDTGAFLGNVGYGAEGDLTFYEGELYMAAENDNIVLVDISDPPNSSIAIDGSVNGRIFGVVSFAETCEEVSVYALTDNAASIYEVNFVDNTLDFYCSIPLQVSGGASTFEFLGSNPVFIDDIITDGFNCGAADGSIIVDASGGIGNLTYSLDGMNYQTSSTFTDLSVQTYIVYVADEIGCVRTEEVTIAANLPQFDEVRITNTLCGEMNGQIEVVVSGGLGPYEFYVNGVLSTTGLIVTDLPDGNYQLEIIDAAGCSITSQANLGSAAPPIITNTGLVSTSCGLDNGSLDIVVTGGLTPLNYSLNGGPVQNSPLFSDLAAGDYSILVVDQSGCSVEDVVTVMSSTAVVIDEVITLDARCGFPNGSLNVVASGGQAPLEYQLDDQPALTFPFLTLLSAGTYELQVRDAAGCTAVMDVTLNDSPPIALSVLQFQAANCQENDGVLSVGTTGGSGPVQVSLNGAFVAEPQVITDLAGGNYLLEAIDTLGCSDTLNIQIPIANCPVYVPNIFSPNRDGVNDYFAPVSVQGVGIEVLRFQIFDRWGGVVFEQGGGLLGDSQLRWDGRRGGELLSQGVYVYFLDLRYSNGDLVRLSGDVTLLW